MDSRLILSMRSMFSNLIQEVQDKMELIEVAVPLDNVDAGRAVEDVFQILDSYSLALFEVTATQVSEDRKLMMSKD